MGYNAVGLRSVVLLFWLLKFHKGRGIEVKKKQWMGEHMTNKNNLCCEYIISDLRIVIA